ncbi:MAG: biotin synthase BioB [Rickettsiales bacterium]|nr:biotin synthase BioB [Rickettsiales bacterium]
MSFTYEQIEKIYDQNMMDLIFKAHTVHRENFDPNEMQVSTLLNIKTGGCPENCAYCPQSAHYNTGLQKEALMSVDDILEKAKIAKENGATRFCVGTAWRSPVKRDMQHIVDVIKGINHLGLESCATLGMLTKEQAETLKEAGLEYYNHNIDSSEDFYKKIISTRTYEQRLETLQNVRDSGMKVCCGGIVGMGETKQDRINFLRQLVTLSAPPESVPINKLIRVKGTPLENAKEIDNTEIIRTIATARIILPKSRIRLSAGRTEFSDEMHLMCFFVGANSIFFGDKLLTTKNPGTNHDLELLAKFNMKTQNTSDANVHSQVS